MNPRTIYFDNPATSWPKPDKVLAAIKNYFDEIGGSPGRSGHRMSIAASEIVESCRENLGRLFAFSDTEKVIFTKNVTEALNTAIQGLVRPGCHVITTMAEHNSVIRPLRHLEETDNISLSVVPCDHLGCWDPEAIIEAIRPETKLVVIGHASNVTGHIYPIEEVLSDLESQGVFIIIDGAQSAGAIPIDISSKIYDSSIYCFTGHKSLLGPTGIGGMLIGAQIDVAPLLQGGTGSSSDLDVQPSGYPDKLESGTLNIVGITGLNAALQWLREHQIHRIWDHERHLCGLFLEEANKIEKLQIYGPMNLALQLGVISFNIQGMAPSQVGYLLDAKYNIMSRIGLHCNPNAHKALGTFPGGTVRFGFSPFSTDKEILAAVKALQEIAEE